MKFSDPDMKFSDPGFGSMEIFQIQVLGFIGKREFIISCVPPNTADLSIHFFGMLDSRRT